jgi:hypothetical protein
VLGLNDAAPELWLQTVWHGDFFQFKRISSNQRLWRSYFLACQHMLQLQCVGWSLSLGMVVGSDKYLLGFGRHVRNFLFDPAQFVLRIQVVILFIAILGLEPLFVSAVQPQISE